MKLLENSVIDIKCEINKGSMTIHRAQVIETYDVSDLLKEFVEHKLQTKLIEEDRVKRPQRLKYAVSRLKEKIRPYCSRTFIVPKMIEVAGGQVFQVGLAEAVKWI
jgi:hypothetical protein